MKIKECIIYILTIAFNISLGFLVNTVLFSGNKSMFIFSSCGVSLLVLFINYIVSQKLNYKLDIFAYDIKNIKHLILNSIFIACLFCFPINMFISLAL